MGSWGSMDILSGSGPDDLGSNPSDSAFYASLHLRNFFLASCEITLARTAGCLREAQRGHEARRAGEERGEGTAK